MCDLGLDKALLVKTQKAQTIKEMINFIKINFSTVKNCEGQY